MLIYLILVRVVLVSCCSVYGARLGCIKSVRLNWCSWNRHVPVQCAVHAWGSLFNFHVLFGVTSWSNHAYFMHTHRYMILSLFYTYFRGVGMKRPFRPTTFRDHLSKSSFLFSFPKNCIQQLPLPTSQARAGRSRQFKQVVVVDIAVVVVLVVVVVDLHLIHLV